MIKMTKMKGIELFKQNLLWSYMKNRMMVICDVFLLCSDKFKAYEDDASPLIFL